VLMSGMGQCLPAASLDISEGREKVSF